MITKDIIMKLMNHEGINITENDIFYCKEDHDRAKVLIDIANKTFVTIHRTVNSYFMNASMYNNNDGYNDLYLEMDDNYNEIMSDNTARQLIEKSDFEYGDIDDLNIFKSEGYPNLVFIDDIANEFIIEREQFNNKNHYIISYYKQVSFLNNVNSQVRMNADGTITVIDTK